MLEPALEAVVEYLSAVDGGSDLDAARSEFEARTGAFEVGDPCYESRIRFFLDWYLCEHISADGSRPPARFLAAQAGTADEREGARACLGASRSLYAVRDVTADAVWLEDVLGGARFRIGYDPHGITSRFRVRDVFDGRLLVAGGRICLAPGLIFHPPEAHEALEELLRRVRADGFEDRVEILDGLLRMRMRLDRFTSIRARHIYRHEALSERDILSAGWARRTSS